MEGYILTPIADRKGFFKASKLGDITVKVNDDLIFARDFCQPL